MRALAAVLLLAGCYDFNADLAAYCEKGHRDCPLSCPDSGVCTLAASQRNVYDVTLHNGTLYWSEEAAKGSIWQLPLGGGAPSVLVSSESFPISVVASDDAVFWATAGRGTGTINRAPLDGGARFTLADHLANPCRLRLNQDTLIWSDNPADAGHTISELALTAGSPQVVAQGTTLCRFAAAPEAVYWADAMRDGGVFRLPAGGAPELLAGPYDFTNSVAVDSTYLYWVTYSSSGGVWRSLRDGTAPTQLVGNQSHVATVVTDGVSVYYGTFTGDGQVLKVSTNGGDPTVIASGQIQPLVQAVDDQFVYWSTLDADGGVFRAPK
jgi:hypothetical protein